MSKKKISIITGVLVIVLITLIVGGGIVFANHYYSKMKTTNSLDKNEASISEELLNKEKESDVINIALFGVDRDGDGSNGRSDAIKVISLNMKNKQIKMLSFQRDTLIYIPDENNDFDKLNHAYWYGGVELALKTLNYNFDLDITRYVSFNFDAIEKIIDTMGGIEIDVKSSELNVTNEYIRGLNEESAVAKDTPYLTYGGLQTLSGRQAMAYMRNRYVGNDFTRMERQSKVIEAMVSKAAALNYTDLLGLLDACLPYVETNLSLMDMVSYGTQVLSFDLENIQEIQIPASDNKHKTVSYKGYSPLYVMNSYQDLIRQLHSFIYGDIDYQPSQTVIENENAIFNKFGYVQ